jgi:hypothetical protein
MPQARTKNLVRLAAPLKEFKIPVVSWRPTRPGFQEFQQKHRVTYQAPSTITVQGNKWLRICAYDVNNEIEGVILLPPKYYPLWRRLVYGGLYNEKLFEAWNKNTRLGRSDLNNIEKQMVRLKHNAGIRFVQYLLCRRLVLDELRELRFNDPNVVI